MKNILRKFLILLLSATLCVSVSPTVSFAKIYIGDQGDNQTTGDVNSDGIADTNDVKLLLMYVHFPEVYELSVDEKYVDYNGDDIVDDGDAVYLLMHTMFPTYYKI